jgi:hypothetical protein
MPRPDAAGLVTIMSIESARQKPTAPAQNPAATAGTDAASPDERAREVEAKMTDDERFSLVISLSGATRFTSGVRDKRYP